MAHRVMPVGLLLASCLVAGGAAPPVPPRRPAVAVLLEDNAEALLKQMTNPTGDSGEGHVEKGVVFSGKSSARIVPMQRFHPSLPGWKYRIAEKPGPGEFRYLRFAWKADGCAGIMIQLHDLKDWNVRYTAGVDQFNWGSKFVAARPPATWALVTRDLYKDFGSERTITGMALTAFGGRAAYFDHIYLGRTIEDLDRVDATGLRGARPVAWTAGQLERLWEDLAAEDASKQYLAFWKLVASSRQAVPFLKRKLPVGKPGAVLKQARQWLRELDDDDFEVRERASMRLAEHLATVAGLLERELARGPSLEVRKRIERLLARRKVDPTQRERIESAVRVLEQLDVPEARSWLEALGKGADGAPLTEAARAALRRARAWRGE